MTELGKQGTPQCDCCSHNTDYPLCANYSSGLDGDSSPEFELNSESALNELRGLEEASYYAGKVVVTPQRWTKTQKLELLLWHPLFTGVCPNCRQPCPTQEPVLTHFKCHSCNWKDDSLNL